MHKDHTYKVECLLCGTRKATWITDLKIYICKDCFLHTKSFAEAIEKAKENNKI